MADAEADAGATRPGLARFLPAILSAAAFWWFLGRVPHVAEVGPIDWSRPWAPSLGVDFAFRLDGLGMVFALLVTGIGALILLYTAEYFARHRHRNRLLLLLALFEASMLGLVLADDAITLFLFWEGTTVTSFLLIGFDHEKADARAKAIQALLVTGLGGVALLGGLLLMAAETGTFRISGMAAAAPGLADAPLYGTIFWLVILGCFTKSAQIPFHFWLPNAMAAPTPVSAYLHSATMVKAGVYLLARLSPTLGGTDLWTWTLTLAGGATMLLSSVWALRQGDLKLGLAHTTVMGLGALTLFLGLGGEAAIVGFCVFLVVHALYKAALFLVIGILDKKAGTREADGLGGLGRAMPVTFAVAALAGLSMAGVMPFFGFIAKEALYEGALHAGPPGVAAAVAALAANAMMFAFAGAVALNPFVGDRRAAAAEPRDPSPLMWIGPGALAALGLWFGLAPGVADHALIAPMAASVAGRPVEPHLALWHGVNLPLLLSLVTFGLGYLIWRRLPDLRARLVAAEGRGLMDSAQGRRGLAGALLGRHGLRRFEGGYDAAVKIVHDVSRDFARLFQSGRLVGYLRLTFGAMAAVTLAALGAAFAGGAGPPAVPSQPAPATGLIAAALIAAGTLALPFTASRLLQIMALGVVGTGVALFFAIYSAIDVAITQLMVETLVVVIIAVALLKLPRLTLSAEARRARLTNLAISGAMGAAVAGALAAVMSAPLDERVTDYYEKTSGPVAHGYNIVNVILVDFRGVDTMGEIAVIATAGLAALALLAARIPSARGRDE
jgi:multicomponent Na+:H+ antiporter subunit A